MRYRSDAGNVYRIMCKKSANNVQGLCALILQIMHALCEPCAIMQTFFFKKLNIEDNNFWHYICQIAQKTTKNAAVGLHSTCAVCWRS